MKTHGLLFSALIGAVASARSMTPMATLAAARFLGASTPGRLVLLDRPLIRFSALAMGIGELFGFRKIPPLGEQFRQPDHWPRVARVLHHQFAQVTLGFIHTAMIEQQFGEFEPHVAVGGVALDGQLQEFFSFGFTARFFCRAGLLRELNCLIVSGKPLVSLA